MKLRKRASSPAKEVDGGEQGKKTARLASSATAAQRSARQAHQPAAPVNDEEQSQPSRKPAPNSSRKAVRDSLHSSVFSIVSGVISEVVEETLSCTSDENDEQALQQLGNLLCSHLETYHSATVEKADLEKRFRRLAKVKRELRSQLLATEQQIEQVVQEISSIRHTHASSEAKRKHIENAHTFFVELETFLRDSVRGGEASENGARLAQEGGASSSRATFCTDRDGTGGAGAASVNGLVASLSSGALLTRHVRHLNDRLRAHLGALRSQLPAHVESPTRATRASVT
eukprot:jgi/Mesvir1/3894/Mv19840-RA.1